MLEESIRGDASILQLGDCTATHSNWSRNELTSAEICSLYSRWGVATPMRRGRELKAVDAKSQRGRQLRNNCISAKLKKIVELTEMTGEGKVAISLQ